MHMEVSLGGSLKREIPLVTPKGRWGNTGTAASIGHYGGMVTGGKQIYSKVKLSQNSFVHHKSHTQFLVTTPVTA